MVWHEVTPTHKYSLPHPPPSRWCCCCRRRRHYRRRCSPLHPSSHQSSIRYSLCTYQRHLALSEYKAERVSAVISPVDQKDQGFNEEAAVLRSPICATRNPHCSSFDCPKQPITHVESPPKPRGGRTKAGKIECHIINSH